MAQEEDATFESDVDDWEIEEGLPQMEDQFIQKYLQGRDALIEQENKHRSGLLQSLKVYAKVLTLHTRLCLPPVTVTHGTFGLSNCISYPGGGASHNLDQGVRG